MLAVACIFAAIAVELSIFLMTVTNTEHLPAAGVALGLVLDGFDHIAVIVVIIRVISIVLLKNLLKSFLKNLI